jgi:hypothetical protein
MNKKLITIIFAIGLLFSAMPAMAATNFSFSPATVNVTEGKTFSVSVASNPNGVANFTTKMVVSFPADLLEVRSFTMGDNWMPLIQPGYNLVDNVNGSLIKTGGYPNPGYSSSVNFGTITFYAKKAGTGTVRIGTGSVSYDATNKNVIGTSPSMVSLVISAVPVVKTPVVTTPTKPVVTTPTKPVVEEPVVETPVETPTETVTPVAEEPVSAQASFLTALGDALSFRICLTVAVWILLFIIFFILGYLTRFLVEKRRKWKK